jgi:predicted acyl esterase
MVARVDNTPQHYFHWLRASHRKLDSERSLSYRPYHALEERWWFTRGGAVECQVNIWPTSMVFRKSHKLRLDIMPGDGVGIRTCGGTSAETAPPPPAPTAPPSRRRTR